jgi:cytochrome P450
MPLLHEYHLDKILFPKLAAGRDRYMAYSKSQAAERMKSTDVDRKDFFYYLLKARDPDTGLGFSVPELWGESNLLIIAGSDTTSTALSSSFFYLVHNPTSLETAAKEVRERFGNVEDIHGCPELNSCVFLRACIDEAMRLSPPVGGILPREVLPDGLDIDGCHIPAGIAVGTPHYTLHHNPAYFPDPFSYIPERWIVGSVSSLGQVSKEDVEVARGAFCAFSIGPRGCIGKGMAYTELMIALGRALFLYDIRLAPGRRVGEGGKGEWGRNRETEYQLKDSFTSMKDGPLVEFRVR